MCVRMYVHVSCSVYMVSSDIIYIHIVANSQGIQRNNPGAMVDILEHPLDQGKVRTYVHAYIKHVVVICRQYLISFAYYAGRCC